MDAAEDEITDEAVDDGAGVAKGTVVKKVADRGGLSVSV